jgi:nucleotidyltransferase substrate binding protein (TIGR01987 family)
MGTHDIRWKQRLQNFERAYARLARACDQEDYSELELAGLVQTFEFTFELCWKTMKDLLSHEGYQATSPREVIRTAFEFGLVHDPRVWLEALESRNRLSHTYDEEVAQEAETLIKQTYAPMIEAVLTDLRARSGAT